MAGRKKIINRSWKTKLDISQTITGRNRTKKGPNRINQLNKRAELWKKILYLFSVGMYFEKLGHSFQTQRLES